MPSRLKYRLVLSICLPLLAITAAFAQSTRAIDRAKSVMEDEVYYLIPVEEDRDKDKDKDKDKDASEGTSSTTQSAGAKSDSQVSAIGGSAVMAPGGGGGGPGGGGSSGPDPVHETYARQNIKEDLTPYGSDLLGEQFDLATGTLSFNHTDVILPGNDGLDVSIRRTVNTAQGRFHPDNEFGDWELDVPKMEMTVSSEASGWWADDRCSAYSDPGDVYYFGNWYYNYEYWNGLKMHIPGQGVQTVLDNPKDPVRPGGATKKTTTQY